MIFLIGRLKETEKTPHYCKIFLHLPESKNLLPLRTNTFLCECRGNTFRGIEQGGGALYQHPPVNGETGEVTALSYVTEDNVPDEAAFLQVPPNFSLAPAETENFDPYP